MIWLGNSSSPERNRGRFYLRSLVSFYKLFFFRSYSDESSEDSDESAELLEKPESEKKDE